MKWIVWVVLAAVLAGALGFYGGVAYQKAQTPSFTRSGLGGNFGGGGNGVNRSGRLGGGITTGTVLAQDAKSITVKTANGGSQTVFISDQTTVSEQQVLKATDIKVGDQVAAFGQSTNGGIDARMIQIVPPGGSFGFGGRGFGGPPPAGATAPSGG
jgi:hypothetical protein